MSDLCPVDVLLQRIGRLHRHLRNRPAGFEAPRVVVLVPAERDLLPFARRGRHGLGGKVYDDLRITEATWRLLEAHLEWRIPEMNRMLVERATHAEVLEELHDALSACDPTWARHLNDVLGKRAQHGREAEYVTFDHGTPFCDFKLLDSPAGTRLGDKDWQVVLRGAPTGPFGAAVATVRIPGWWVAGQAPPDEPAEVTQDAGALSFAIGGTTFHCDRFGLTKG